MVSYNSLALIQDQLSVVMLEEGREDTELTQDTRLLYQVENCFCLFNQVSFRVSFDQCYCTNRFAVSQILVAVLFSIGLLDF